MSRRRDSNPEPPDYKGGAIRLIRPPTSDAGYTASPSGCLKPLGWTPFRVTNDVTLPMERPAGAQRDLRFIHAVGSVVCVSGGADRD